MRKSKPGLTSGLGVVVRELRKKRGLSQEALADATGLHRTYIGAVERAERNLTLRSLERLALALGVPASELLKRAEKASDGA